MLEAALPYTARQLLLLLRRTCARNYGRPVVDLTRTSAAEILGCSTRSIQRAQDQLQQAGLVHVQRVLAAYRRAPQELPDRYTLTPDGG